MGIDIMPHPSIRDRLIAHHASDPNLDNIICEIAEAFVVELDLSDMVMGCPSAPGFIGVWDLARAIDDETGVSVDGQHVISYANEMTFGAFPFGDCNVTWTPAQDTGGLFRNRNKARLAWMHLGLTAGAVNWKLDPALFNKYPHLLDPESDIRAVGTRLRPRQQVQIPRPRQVDYGSMSMYRELARTSLPSSIMPGLSF